MFDSIRPGAFGDTIESLRNRVAAVKQQVLDRLSLRQVKIATIGTMSISTMSVPAAAQSVSDVGQAMCGTGVGELVGFAFIAGSVFYLLKGVGMGMSAVDKMGSTKQKSAREGKEALAGAAKTSSAAFLPAVAAGVFEVLGINTVSCLAPSNWSIIGTIVVNTPF